MTDPIYSGLDTDQAIVDQWNAWFNALPGAEQKKVLDWFVEKLVRRIAETLVKAHEKNFENFSETPLQGQIPMV